MTITEFLKGHVPFLAGLSEEEAHELAVAAEQAVFAAGRVILMQGTTVDGLHVVAEGRLSVEVKKGKQPAGRVAELRPGMVFGETSIIEAGVASATIKAIEESLVFIIPQEAFRALLQRKPELKKSFEDGIARRRAKTNPPGDGAEGKAA